MTLIEFDGSQGEGGGQILRTALSLSMITGKPFRMEKIRAKRSRPGLLRQHLTAVKAAGVICSAKVTGDTLGSSRLVFEPGEIRAGDYEFSIGSAGSSTLVLQTLLPALLFGGDSSQVSVCGGTHNPAAPPADFLMRGWLPLLTRMGIHVELELLRHGFFPAGGGQVSAKIHRCSQFVPLDLKTRGALKSIRAVAVVAAIPDRVAERELDVVRACFPSAELEYRSLPTSEGPGNVLMIEMAYDNVVEVFCGFGQKGVSAETVAARVVGEARQFHASGAAVGEHMADQLLIPMALAGAGNFTTNVLSLHLKTNAEVIEKFMPVKFDNDVTDGLVNVQVL